VCHFGEYRLGRDIGGQMDATGTTLRWSVLILAPDEGLGRWTMERNSIRMKYGSSLIDET
jgi:hypothetical protein